MADPEKKQATQDKSYRGKRVQLCTDGKYRWQYEVNMYTNPAIFLFSVYQPSQPQPKPRPTHCEPTVFLSHWNYRAWKL